MGNTIILDLTNITVHLPPDKIIVERKDYESLKEKVSEGRYMPLTDILELLSVSRPWLLENVLYKPDIRSQIDIDKNLNGFVKYPKNQGERYYFLASQAKTYFEQHFKDIFS